MTSEGAPPARVEDLAGTRRWARFLAERLPVGALLLIDGPLGAGKTTLVQELVAALDGDAAVTSPTYTLVHEYPTPAGTVVHVDAYRLDDAAALLQLGFDEYLERARLVAVEWGRTLAAAYPEAWQLEMRREGDDARRLELRAPGA